MTRSAMLVALALLAVPEARAWDEAADLVTLGRIREEGFSNSKVMDHLFQLTDVIGPRLTGSPQLKRANEWTRDQLASWGLKDAHLHAWHSGPGWSMERASVHLVAPDTAPLIAYPKAWSLGTNGPLRAKAIKAKLESDADFAAFKGKLAGLIVLTGDARAAQGADKPFSARHDPKTLHELEQFDMSARYGGERATWVKRMRFLRARDAFLADEKAVAAIDPSRMDHGVFVSWGRRNDQLSEPSLPTFAMQLDQYNRLVRLLDAGKEVELELDARVRVHDQDSNSYNTIAEIPGLGARPEVVMVGAHIDSWHAGTGATDNAAGVAVVMEAVRILKALGLAPKRTIRVGLWSGEEQGLLGVTAYVEKHFGGYFSPTNPEDDDLVKPLRRAQGPLTVKPDHARLALYLNLDNGAGRIRGLYTQKNLAAGPIFERWLKPLHDLGATTVTNRPAGGTDHIAFDDVGLPAFQFIQDELDYDTRTHHTQLDTYDHVPKEDLTQAAVVMASILWQAASHDGPFPRKPLPPALPVAKPAPKP